MKAQAIHVNAFYVGIALLVLLGFIILLGFFGAMQKTFLLQGLFSTSNPIALLAIFAIIIFGAVYLLRTGTQIIKATIK